MSFLPLLSCPPLTPALSPRWGEREHCQGSFLYPLSPNEGRVRVRGKKSLALISFKNH